MSKKVGIQRVTSESVMVACSCGVEFSADIADCELIWESVRSPVCAECGKEYFFLCAGRIEGDSVLIRQHVLNQTLAQRLKDLGQVNNDVPLAREESLAMALTWSDEIDEAL